MAPADDEFPPPEPAAEIALQLHLHPAHRLIQPFGELVEKALLEPGLCPIVEDETEVGKPALLQEQKAIDVIFMPALGAGEVIGCLLYTSPSPRDS